MTDDTDPLGPFAERLGHRFARPALLERALTHRSAADPRQSQLDSNERLEFLGDRVLNLYAAERLMALDPDAREGAMSRRLASLGN
jgi:ribonuclease-3